MEGLHFGLSFLRGDTFDHRLEQRPMAARRVGAIAQERDGLAVHQPPRQISDGLILACHLLVVAASVLLEGDLRSNFGSSLTEPGCMQFA